MSPRSVPRGRARSGIDVAELGDRVVRADHDCGLVRDDSTRQLHVVGTGAKRPAVQRLERNVLAGELLLYETGTVGVVAQVYTAPARRRQHVAMFLLERARQCFYQDRMQEAIADVRLRMVGAVALFSSAGYRQSEVVCRYPGVDFQAG